MSAVKAEPNVGELATGDERRDAIHVAVVMVTAKEKVWPGQCVNANGGSGGEIVGIVDPFLPHFVMEGERYWLFLKPRTVTSLRHVWTHPAFTDEAEGKKTESADQTKEWKESHKYLKKLADRLEITTKELVDGMRSANTGGWGEGLHIGFTTPDYNPEEAWNHWAIVTGEKVRSSSESFVSCSC